MNDYIKILKTHKYVKMIGIYQAFLIYPYFPMGGHLPLLILNVHQNKNARTQLSALPK
jgi:hypothetical protein